MYKQCDGGESASRRQGLTCLIHTLVKGLLMLSPLAAPYTAPEELIATNLRLVSEQLKNAAEEKLDEFANKLEKTLSAL